MKRFRYLVWIVVPLSAGLIYLTIGAPHLRWKYIFLDEGQGHDPLAPRYYTSCTYQSVWSSFRIDAPDSGQCPLIRFR